MASPLFLGLDLGSTTLKAAAFRADDGAVRAQAGVPVPWQRHASGACEVRERALHELLETVLRAVVGQLGDQARDIAAMACAGHGGGLYAVSDTGALITGMAVSSTDQRASAFTQAVASTSADDFARDVGCGPWAGQPTMIAGHVEAAAPGSFGHTRALLFAKDWLAFQLCGALGTDYSDATTPGLLDTATGRPSQAAFAASGIAGWGANTLAPLRDSGHPLGTLLPAVAARLGLPEGLPIAMGAIDLYAGMTGVGCTAPGDTAAVFGTWCVNAAIVSPDLPLAMPCAGLSNIALLDSRLARMAMHNGSSSMANLAWLTDLVFAGQRDAALDAAFAAPAGANGLRFVPFINGGAGNASAGFIGLRAFHSRADMARATLEAIVALHARSLKAMRDAGLARRRLFALGGGAADPRIAGLLATMLGETVYTPGADESGARGAALFAARSLGQPTQGLLARCSAIDPEAHAFYRDFLADFNGLLTRLEPVFGHLQIRP